MRRLTLIASLCALCGAAQADIQAPPGSEYTSIRKLGRSVGNILYSITEIPVQIARTSDREGGNAGWSYGMVDGTHRFLRRFGYGWYELFTFYCPTYHGTFKPPYERCGQDWRQEMDPVGGLSEFPPELGFEGYYTYSRAQGW